MIGFHVTSEGMVLDAHGTTDELGQDLLGICEAVLASLAEQDDYQAVILRSWLLVNLRLNGGAAFGSVG